MKSLSVVVMVLGMLLMANWCDARLRVAQRAVPAHPMVLRAVKQIRLPAESLRTLSTLQEPTLTLYDATSENQLAYDGSFVYTYSPNSGEIFREQIPLLGPARLDTLEILYTAGGPAGSTVNATIIVYGCLSGFVGDDPEANLFPVIATFTDALPADGTYLLTLDLGGVVYDAGSDLEGKPYAHDLLVHMVFTGTNVPRLFIANGANSLGLRNDGGGLFVPALFPLGAGAFWDDVGDRFHMDNYFTGTSQNVWRQSVNNYWWGGSPLGNFSITVRGSYNFVGRVFTNAGVESLRQNYKSTVIPSPCRWSSSWMADASSLCRSYPMWSTTCAS